MSFAFTGIVRQDTYAPVPDGQQTQLFRVNRRGELVTSDWISQLAQDGRMWVGGSGPEVGGINSAAALDDTTPTFALKAPSDGTVLLVIGATMSMTVEGDAAPEMDIVYDSVSRTLSGTALTEILNMRAGSPKTSIATAVHTATAGAGTGATLAHYEITDNQISAGSASVMDKVVIEWKPIVPLPLVNGAQLYFYGYTGTADSQWVPAIYWAELDEGDYS